jgi:DNA polymerase-3 subunit delta
MKLTWKQIEPFVRAPDKKARVILVYGPDDGLMRERSKAIGKTVVDNLDDPFNAVALSTDILQEDPARLADEANALSMMSGARLIRIEDGSDKLTPLLKDYLQDPSDDNLVIVEAGELGPRSSLRQLCEKSKNAAALPCYVEDERGVANLVREIISGQGYFIDHDAAQFLAQNAAGDRARIRSEVEKLILYMGKEKHIALADVQASTGQAGTASLDDLVYGMAAGDVKKSIHAYSKLIGEGVSDIVILRAIQNHFRRLHYTAAMMQGGKSLDEAVKSLTPPIFFKLEDSFKGQVRKWQGPRLAMTLDKLAQLEAETKKTAAPVQTLCSQAILAISAVR